MAKGTTDNGVMVLYETPDFLVINKPAGLLVHSSAHQKSVSEPTLVDWLLRHYPSVAGVGDEPLFRPGIVHRLDKDTSGVLLVALTQKGFDYCKGLFLHHQITKEYVAIVLGAIHDQRGTINKPIGIKSGTTKHSVFSSKDAKEAITNFVVERIFDYGGQTFSLVRLFPQTGRTHQLRVHCNFLHHPIAGDPLYGGRTARDSAPRLMLHAQALSFVDMGGQFLRIEAPLPEPFSAFLDN